MPGERYAAVLSAGPTGPLWAWALSSMPALPATLDSVLPLRTPHAPCPWAPSALPTTPPGTEALQATGAAWFTHPPGWSAPIPVHAVAIVRPSAPSLLVGVSPAPAGTATGQPRDVLAVAVAVTVLSYQ